MNEYCFEIILLLAAHEGDGADQHRDVEQDLLLFAGDALVGAVVLFHAYHIAVDDQTVLIVRQTLEFVERGIEKERIVIMRVIQQIAIEHACVARRIHTDGELQHYRLRGSVDLASGIAPMLSHLIEVLNDKAVLL